eukprot:TRINITY_DN5322_c0_g1_i1.p1 TRINITY_DN5322_c0_g1~~TRINITY_DN5322_c0_g1_i1.p1  ORF type:complete len:604 (+),score=76.42 TRINITY_DN5322_c0_g1_i1:64-1875(+)
MERKILICRQPFLLLIFVCTALALEPQANVRRGKYFYMDPNDELMLFPQPNHINSGETILPIPSPCDFQFFTNFDQRRDYITQVLTAYRSMIFPETDCGRASSFIQFRRPSEGEQGLYIHILTPIYDYPRIDDNESYTLVVEEGNFKLIAATYIGFVHGIETFSQLVYTNKTKDQPITYYIPKTPLKILDKPIYQHRGLMLDISRHFFTKQTIKRQIDGLSYAKMNVLHLHLTDDDNFPLDIPSYPDLARTTTYDDDQIYTRADMTEIIEYAAARGIRVIAEIDAPGHTRSWSDVPELKDIVTGWDERLSALWHGYLNPVKDKTYDVLEKIFKDVYDIFPGEFIHLGADEPDFRAWEKDESIKQFMKDQGITNSHELLNYFIKRQRDTLSTKLPSKNYVYWSNADTLYLRYAEGDTIQWWGNTSMIPEVIKQYDKQKIILSAWDYLYLDAGSGNPFGTTTWCDPYKTWDAIYNFNISEITGGSDRVLGAEACSWNEVVNEYGIDVRLWPRTAVLGERLWSKEFSGIVSRVKRLVAHVERMKLRGIGALPITSEYCSRNVERCFPILVPPTDAGQQKPSKRRLQGTRQNVPYIFLYVIKRSRFL